MQCITAVWNPQCAPQKDSYGFVVFGGYPVWRKQAGKKPGTFCAFLAVCC